MVIEALAEVLGQLLNGQGMLLGLKLATGPFEVVAGYFFDQFDEIFDPDEMAKTDADVGIAPMTQRLRKAFPGLLDARGGNGHPELQGKVILGIIGAVHLTAILPEQAGFTGGFFLEEIGKLNLHMGLLGLKFFLHLFKDEVEAAQIDIAMEAVEDLNKAAHVGPLEMMGKIHRHINGGHTALVTMGFVQNGNRVRYFFYPHLFNADSAVVLLALDIFHGLVLQEGAAITKEVYGPMLKAQSGRQI